jgi:cell division inhibitor SulA
MLGWNLEDSKDVPQSSQFLMGFADVLRESETDGAVDGIVSSTQLLDDHLLPLLLLLLPDLDELSDRVKWLMTLSKTSSHCSL